MTPNPMLPDETFGQYVARRFGGVLRKGGHKPDGEACALEARSQALGIEWTDSPIDTHFPDLRSLNDAAWPDDATRTAHLVPVMEALWGWAGWGEARRQRFAQALAARTIGEILPPILEAVGLAKEAERCRTKRSEAAAKAAAWATSKAAKAAEAAGAAWAAAEAVWAAAEAAEAAAKAAAEAAARAAARAAAKAAAWAAAEAATMLILTCRIWRECAEASTEVA